MESWKMNGLYLQAACYLLLAKIMIRFVPMKHWLYFLGEKGLSTETQLSEHDHAEARRVRKALYYSLVRLPGGRERFSCLVQVLAVAWMLRQRKIAFTSYIVVQLSLSLGMQKKLRAHAWLSSGGEMIIFATEAWFSQDEILRFVSQP